MAMLASIERDDTSIMADDSYSYSVTGPSAESQKEILRSLNRAASGRVHDTQRSAFLRANSILEHYREKLDRLSRDPYLVLGDDAEAPSSESIDTALKVLQHLLAKGLEPENVSLSADSGIAIRFRPEVSRRTYLEILNDGGQHMLQYDEDGHVNIHQLADCSPLQIASFATRLLQSI
jgi:hypothetical protein